MTMRTTILLFVCLVVLRVGVTEASLTYIPSRWVRPTRSWPTSSVTRGDCGDASGGRVVLAATLALRAGDSGAIKKISNSSSSNTIKTTTTKKKRKRKTTSKSGTKKKKRKSKGGASDSSTDNSDTSESKMAIRDAMKEKDAAEALGNAIR